MTKLGLVFVAAMSFFVSSAAQANELPQTIQDAIHLHNSESAKRLKNEIFKSWGIHYKSAEAIALNLERNDYSPAVEQRELEQLQEALDLVQVHDILNEQRPLLLNDNANGILVTDKEEIVKILNTVYSDCDAKLVDGRITLGGIDQPAPLVNFDRYEGRVFADDLEIRVRSAIHKVIESKNAADYLVEFRSNRDDFTILVQPTIVVEVNGEAIAYGQKNESEAVYETHNTESTFHGVMSNSNLPWESQIDVTCTRQDIAF